MIFPLVLMSFAYIVGVFLRQSATPGAVIIEEFKSQVLLLFFSPII